MDNNYILEEDNISISSGLPSGSFTFDDACSDDTDFLVMQNLSHRELFDERSSTTTDLLYQGSVLHMVDDEKDLPYQLPAPERAEITLQLEHDSNQQDKKEVKSTWEQSYSLIPNDLPSFAEKSSPRLHDNNLSNGIIEKFSDLRISSPLRLGLSSIPTFNTDDHSCVEEPNQHIHSEHWKVYKESTLGISKEESNQKKDFLYHNKQIILPVDNISDQGIEPKFAGYSSGGDKFIQQQDIQQSYQINIEEVESFIDEKVQQGQKIIAELFGKVELKEKEAMESKLKQVHEWATSEEISEINAEQSSVLGSGSRDGSISKGPKNHSIKSKESPSSKQTAESSYSTESKHSVSIPSKEGSPVGRDKNAHSAIQSSLGGKQSQKLQFSSFSTSILGTSTPQSKEQWSLKNQACKKELFKSNGNAIRDTNEGNTSDIDHLFAQKQELIAEIGQAMNTLQRLQGDVKSLEQLTEQHRQQAVKARSELLSVERLRDEAQATIDDLHDAAKEQTRVLTDSKVKTLVKEKEELEEKIAVLTENEIARGSVETEVSRLKQKVDYLKENMEREQQNARETISNLNKQLEEERSKAREMQIEKMTAIKGIREELLELNETEKRDITDRLTKEKTTEVEILEAKHARELNKLTALIKEKDKTIDTLQGDLVTAESATSELQGKLHELEMKAVMKSQEYEDMSSNLSDTKVILEKETAASKNREMKLLNEVKKLNKELVSANERYQQLQEKLESEKRSVAFQSKNKDKELVSLQKMLAQSEESSRSFGERMRKEAKEMVHMALSEERENHLQEVTQMKCKIEQMALGKESLVQTHNREIQQRTDDIKSLRNTIEKLKKELEEYKKQSFEAQEQKVIAVTNTRTEMKEEIVRLKEKIKEMEKRDKSVSLEIAEECMKISVITGSSSPLKKSSWLISPEKSSSSGASLEAMKVLKQNLDQMKTHFMNLKRELEGSKEDFIDQDIDSTNFSSSSLDLLRKKDETITNMQRQMKEMESQFQLEKEVQETRHKETLEKVEKEIKSLSNNINESTPGTPRSVDRTNTPAINSLEESSTAKLLRHLQGRVKQLRAQNQSMKLYSEDDSHSSEVDTNSTSLSLHDLSADNSPSTMAKKVSVLEQSLKKAEDYGHRNAVLLNQKMSEMSKLQKMLTHASKENMKLERAHANLQYRLADMIGK